MGLMPWRDPKLPPAPDEMPVFLDVPANRNEGSMHGPAFVVPGKMITSGMTLMKLTDEQFKNLDKMIPNWPPPGY